MSEPNNPSRNPSQPDSSTPDLSLEADISPSQVPPGSTEWYSGWEDFSADDVNSSSSLENSSPVPEAPHRWQDFPNAISTDATERQSLYHSSTATSATARPEPTFPKPTLPGPTLPGATIIEGMLDSPSSQVMPPLSPSTPSAVRVEDITPSPQTNVSELVNLIQELNQCNNALLDRVSQLEEELEHQLTQSHFLRAQPAQPAPTVSPVSGQEKVAELENHLEFVEQTNKRQQILIETLTGQLQSSQERVAQLERECASLQQRFNEQAQLLMQSESANRDLQARLQRQQRYTLQFKAALEKCLEVPPPSYGLMGGQDSPEIAIGDESQENFSPYMLLPKVQRIQPWSAHPTTDRSVVPGEEESGSEPSDAVPMRAIALSPQPTATVLTHLTSLKMMKPSQSATLQTGAESFPSSSSKALNPEAVSAAASQLDESDAGSTGIDPEFMGTLSPDVIQASMVHLENALPENWAELSTRMAATATDTELWEDLARLIEVSAADVLKASLAKNRADFGELQLTSIQTPATAEVEFPETSGGEAAIAEPTPLPDPSHENKKVTPIRLWNESKPQVASSTQTPEIDEAANPFTLNPSWPSPLVHPLRQSKKRKSLAAVDLPKF